MCVNSECVAKEAYKDEYPDPETQLQWQEVKFITLDFSEVSQAKETSWNPVALIQEDINFLGAASRRKCCQGACCAVLPRGDSWGFCSTEESPQTRLSLFAA